MERAQNPTLADPTTAAGADDDQALLDWFAGQALGAMELHGAFDQFAVAEKAYDLAQAMLEERQHRRRLSRQA